MASQKITTYILHGWTQDLSKWDPLVKTLKKSGHKIKLLPIPGLTAKLEKPWNLNDYYNWFLKEIGNQDHINLVGHSFGGRIAIRFVVKNPNLVKKLILIDSAGIRPASFSAVAKRLLFKTVAKVGKKVTASSHARKILYQIVGEKDYYQANKTLAQTMTNVVGEDQKSELQFIKAHTLIIWGSNDKITPIDDGRLMNKDITGSTLKIIDGAGHSPQYSHSDQVTGLITDFLKGS